MIDLNRMSVNTIVKKAENAARASKKKAESEEQAFKERHQEWVRGAINELYSLADLLKTDIGFMSNWTFQQYMDAIDEILATVKVDVNAKNRLRGRLILGFTAFPTKKLDPEVTEYAYRLQEEAEANIKLYSIPQLSKFCDEVSSYAYWKNYAVAEIEHMNSRRGFNENHHT